MNMNFEEKLKQSLSVEEKHINKDRFINDLHAARHELALKKARIQSSVATAVFLLMFGWISVSQLDTTVFGEKYYTYEDNYEQYADLDSSSFDLYVADMALYLLEDEENIWSLLQFFQEEEYEYAFNKQEIKL